MATSKIPNEFLPLPTSTLPGAVYPDGTTITADGTGKISASVPLGSDTPTPETVGTSGSAGSSNLAAREDHVHAQPGIATDSAPGFLSAADKTKLDAYPATPAATPTSLPPSGSAGGDLGGSYPSPTVAAVQGKAWSQTAPTSGQVPTWNGSAWTPATPAAQATALPQSGAAGGDLTGTYPNPTLAAVGPGAETVGDAASSLTLGIDAKGRVVTLAKQAIAVAQSQVSGLVAALAAAFAPATVAAPSSVAFDHADYSGSSELITWRIGHSSGPASGASLYYGVQTSPDNATWTSEVFVSGDVFQGPAFTSGNQYARARAYALTSSGTTPTPSAWISSSSQGYAAPPPRGIVLVIPIAIVTGADIMEVPVRSDFTSRALTRVSARLGTASTSGSVQFSVQYNTGTSGGFTAAQSSDTFTIGSGINQMADVTSFTNGITASAGGDLRINISSAGTGAAYLTVKLEF